jgi:hypothetical protein
MIFDRPAPGRSEAGRLGLPDANGQALPPQIPLTEHLPVCIGSHTTAPAQP